MNLNKAMIIGNLTRDPEVRNTQSGLSVTSFGVATNLVWRDAAGEQQKKVEFHNVVAWRKLAEICGQYLRKGARVYIEGRLQTRDWTGDDGVKRYRTEIIADNMIMLDRAGGNNSGAPTGEPPLPSENVGVPVVDASEPVGGDNTGDEEIKVENIPF